jgi:hypothetical protein
MKNKLTLLFIVFVYFSCQKEINLKTKDSKVQLVLNCILNPDSNIMLSLTKSRAFASTDDKFEIVNDATVKIYEQEKLIFTLTKGLNGIYKTVYKPKVGNAYKITIESANYDRLEATTTILNYPIIDSLKIIANAISNLSSATNTQLYFDKYTVNLQDKKNTNNYYEIILNYHNNIEYIIDSYGSIGGYQLDNKKWLEGTMLITDSDLKENFKKEVDRKDNYYTSDLFFSNKNFKNQTKVLSLYIEKAYINSSDSTNITVSKISDDYYSYLVTLNKQRNAIGAYSEAVKVATNIKNGLGIFGSMSTKKIYLN